jgi:hypothetical protein
MIPMNYPGWAISKNGLWNGGNRRWGMNKEAKRWKQNLADSVQLSLLAQHIFHPIPPVHVEVGATFVDRGSALDLHNLAELVCDAVQDGTGVDDKHFTFATSEPVFKQAMPEIVVLVTVTVEEK